MNREEILKRSPNLQDADVDRLMQLESMLPMIADLSGKDLFIDCMGADGSMYVMAQARPCYMPSMYEGQVVGCIAKREDEPAVYRAMEIAAQVRDLKAVTQERRIVRQDVIPIFGDGQQRMIGFLVGERDVSDEYRKELKYDAMMKKAENPDPGLFTSEKAVSREMHHRMKNQLQILTSLVQIEERNAVSKEAKEALSSTTGRMMSVAAINELLTYSENDSISLMELLCKLTRELSKVFGDKTQIVAEGDDLQIGQNVAADIAIVINELITNAYKHAIDCAGGAIRIIVKRGERYASVTVQDDGKNAGGFSLDENAGMGTTLIRMLVKDKLKGKLYVEPGDGGTGVSFDFPY